MRTDDQRLVALVRQALPPLDDSPDSVDLWRRFEHRVDGRRPSPGRLDWLMVALVLALLAGFPEALLLLLYHL